LSGRCQVISHRNHLVLDIELLNVSDRGGMVNPFEHIATLPIFAIIPDHE